LDAEVESSGERKNRKKISVVINKVFFVLINDYLD
jgi:hypothetical protein